jgi:tRNA threonylcarbamoyladenosine biosynthesis protein TsaE
MHNDDLPAVQQPHVIDFISHSPAQTERIGGRLGEQLRAGDLILLRGPFGAGKTHLVKGIARGMGATAMVTSPSFVLVNEYQAGPRHEHLTIYHVDLYRLAAAAEVESIGLDEIWAGMGVCVIEWPEQAEMVLPAEHLTIHFRHLNETKRILRCVPSGARYHEILEAFKETAFG